ncbi:hypothetical protein OSCI_3440022 [Kamptonema sp. PCC 6506]|nr:hypothetical protein OSCI_3440022 [Kamptonema sp. PCC 6506]
MEGGAKSIAYEGNAKSISYEGDAKSEDKTNTTPPK